MATNSSSSSSGRRLLNRIHGAFIADPFRSSPENHNNNSTGGILPISLSTPMSSSSSSSASAAAGAGGSSSTRHSIIDKKRMDTIYLRLDKLLHLCRQPKLQLKNSPPYLPDIISDIKSHLQLIVCRTNESVEHSNNIGGMGITPAHSTLSLLHNNNNNSSDFNSTSTNNNNIIGGGGGGGGIGATASSSSIVLWRILTENAYLIVFLDTISEKCKYAQKLFKDAKDRIFDESSPFRVKLTKLSLVFSHLLKDLQSIFPDGHYVTSTYLIIQKPDAAQWWKIQFGNRALVNWQEFRTSLFALHSHIMDQAQLSLALQKTIDLTCNYHISVFEFDVFVRLFQPWENIIETWKALAVTHPAYMAFMTYDEVKAILSRFVIQPGPGSFVYRLSCTKLGQWAIGYVTNDKQILQTIVQNKSLAQALLDGQREGFYRFPNGLTSSSTTNSNGGVSYNNDISIIDLESLVNHLPNVHIQVSQEQYDVYCEIGSTFQLCKICAERDKNVRVEPCKHLLCRECLQHWQATRSEDSQLCPFCRQYVRGVEDITVVPHVPPPLPPLPIIQLTNNNTNTPPPPPPPLSPQIEIDLIQFNDDVTMTKTTSPSTSMDSSAPIRPPRVNNVNKKNIKKIDEEEDLEFVEEKESFGVKKLCETGQVSKFHAVKLLNITKNDLEMAEEVLKYFVPKHNENV